jgi:hypothetical protein
MLSHHRLTSCTLLYSSNLRLATVLLPLTHIDAAWTHITENTCHMIASHCCCDVTAHAQAARALHSNHPCTDTQKTPLQYCWLRVLWALIDQQWINTSQYVKSIYVFCLIAQTDKPLELGI